MGPTKEPIPEAPDPAASNSTEKDDWGKGAADGAPIKTTDTPSMGKSRVSI